MRSKKGALFHWIIFGVLAALGLFLVLTTKIEVKELKGDWQLDFLEDYYLEAEKDLLKIDQEAKYAGWQTVLELGEKGEFIEKSDCGELYGYGIWNELKKWCAADVEIVFLAKVKEKLAKSLPDKTYSEVKLKGKDLTGKGEKNSIFSTSGKYVSYTYDTNFRVNLGFDVEREYENLILEAMGLASDCRDNKSLEECIKEKRKDDWKLKDCDNEEYNETERKVLFCVEEGSIVYDGEGNLAPIRHKFALDFTESESMEYTLKGN